MASFKTTGMGLIIDIGFQKVAYLMTERGYITIVEVFYW